MDILRNSTGRDGEWDYPLYDQHELCPTHEYTGAFTVYVCRCMEPTQCPGVLKVAALYGGYGGTPKKILYKVFRGYLQDELISSDRDYQTFAAEGWVDSAEKAWQKWVNEGGSNAG